MSEKCKLENLYQQIALLMQTMSIATQKIDALKKDNEKLSAKIETLKCFQGKKLH